MAALRDDDIVLAAAVRTPTGRLLGSLTGYTAPDLGAIVVREAVSRAGLAATDVDEVVMGHVLQAGVGQNPARQAALQAGLPPSVAATTANKVCGSGLEAVILAGRAVRAGDARIVVAGGMESMTNAPHLLRVRGGVRYGGSDLIDSMEHDGLRDAFKDVIMVTTGDIVADEHKISRADADAFALRSHQRAWKATQTGAFKAETVPVPARPHGVKAKPGDMLESDEGIRPDTTAEALAKLRPAAGSKGPVTAGNASQISDGAAAMVVTAAATAREHGIRPIAVLESSATAGVEPERVMSAPIPGVQKLLKRAGRTIDEVDFVEHNEAFATASCAVRSALQIPDEKFNVNGGAVALGHPLGASGARILTTLLHTLAREDGSRGIATLCLGGGNSVQVLVRRA